MCFPFVFGPVVEPFWNPGMCADVFPGLVENWTLTP